MKKNLLFVMPSLSAGGGEKSLVNLLSQIDYNLYNVDLFLMNHDGLFMEYLPKEVKVLPIPESYKLFTLPFYQAIESLIKKRAISLAYKRVLYTVSTRGKKSTAHKEQYSWKHIEKSFENLTKEYDAAIGFLEKTSTYYCIDKVKANKKIGWIHIDYDKLGMDPSFDQFYFKKLDHIVTVSEECANVLKNRFPDENEKIKVMYNIVSPKVITQMANDNKENMYEKKANEIVILSIGRLHYQKGFELAIEACKKLVDKGYNIKWNIIGEGEERSSLTRLIQVNQLENHFKLLGLKANPYPYIQQADIYAQTSRFEGKSIAIDEAKILHKPILLTNFSTAHDQIENGLNGLIVEMNPSAIAQGLENLIQNVDLQEKMAANLAKEKLGTEEEINKLYKMVSGDG